MWPSVAEPNGQQSANQREPLSLRLSHVCFWSRCHVQRAFPPQDQALEIVRSVGLAFEMSQCPEPETGADTGPEEELDGPASPEQLSRPAPGLSRPAPDQLSAESASSASGDDTPRQTDGECLQTDLQRHTLRQTC